MGTWADFLPDVAPHVAGCPTIIVEHELLRAAQEFFRLTRAWRADLPALAIPAGASAAVIPAPADTTLVRVESLTFNGSLLPESTIEQLERDAGQDWRIATGKPCAYTQIDPGAVLFYPVPDADATLIVRASLTPADSATGINTTMRPGYRQAIVAGAKARLMLYPNAAWANQSLAVAYQGEFNSLCDRMNRVAAQGFGKATPRSRVQWC